MRTPGAHETTFPKSRERREENVCTATIEFEGEKQGQGNDTPGPPSYDAHAFINHTQTLGPKDRDEVLDKMVTIEDF